MFPFLTSDLIQGEISIVGESKRVIVQAVHELFDQQVTTPWESQTIRACTLVFIGKSICLISKQTNFTHCWYLSEFVCLFVFVCVCLFVCLDDPSVKELGKLPKYNTSCDSQYKSYKSLLFMSCTDQEIVIEYS